MKNYVQPGDTITVTAQDDTDHLDGSSGDGVLAGLLFGVAVNDFVAGEDVEIKTTGVFDLAKVGSQAWTVGALIYWDDTNLQCTTTAGSNKKIGHAVLAVGSGAGETTGRVRLQGFAT